MLRPREPADHGCGPQGRGRLYGGAQRAPAGRPL